MLGNLCTFFLFSLLVWGLGACVSQEPHRVSEAPIPFVLRFGSNVRDPAPFLRAAELWSASGAVSFEVGAPWDGRAVPSSEGCSREVLIAWVEPTDPALEGDLGDAIGVGIGGCDVRFVGLVRGRVPSGEEALAAAHELGHALGASHVQNGLLAPTIDKMESAPSCEDWSAVCGALGCAENPCD